MANVVDFLLDYYVWILFVLAVIIITIIGFLVDSKQKRKKKEDNVLMDEVKTVESLPEASVNDSIPVVDAKNQQIPTTVDNVLGVDNLENISEQSQSTNLSLNSPSINNDSLKEVNNNQSLSLSEQKPHFEPRNVVIPNTIQNDINFDNVVAVPQPVNAIPINQTISQTVQGGQQVFNSNPQIVSNSSSNVQPMPQFAQVSHNNQFVTQNGVQNNSFNGIQQSVGYQNVSSQIPVIGSQNLQYVGTSNVTNPSQATFSTPNVGINFVTQANDENDDNWKL